MNSAQHFKINILRDIHKAMYDVSHDNKINWDLLTKKELLHEVMVRTRGTVNPKMVEQIINEL